MRPRLAPRALWLLALSPFAACALDGGAAPPSRGPDARAGDGADTAPARDDDDGATPDGDEVDAASGPDGASAPADAPADASGPRGFACDAGGQVANSHGLEAPLGTAVVGLCRQALGCPSSWAFAPPPEADRNSGTPNQKLLWRVWNYGWALRAGTPDQLTDARAFLVAFFDAQRTYGHYAISDGADEVLNTSHYQIWSNGMTCARLLAVLARDAPVLDATGGWWRAETALYNLLAREGSIDSPGARFKPGQQGPSPLRDTLYAMIQHRPLPGAARDPNAPWWSDYYNVSAWTLRELLALGDDLGGARAAGPADVPRLHDPLELRVRGDDYVFVFPRLRAALDPLFWTARIGGVRSYAPYAGTTVVDNPTPPPALPGATITTVPGVGM